ncbi:MAG: phosphoribosyl-AMP cyclohydrolase [Opitutales bacterium]
MIEDDLEEGAVLKLDFTMLRKVAKCETEVLPVIIQDARSKEVLALGYANQLALDTALMTGMATFWNTSNDELWIMGKISGDYLQLKEVRVNRQQNTILYRVGPAENGSSAKSKASLARKGSFSRRVSLNGSLVFVRGKSRG